ncbi:hypothetical protein C7S18_19265 [Ahniella affigens]|uniref:Cytochrome D1 n=1 Tax=Ahniella affigens TaxID=2021234 RepID=A0A2P1PWM0_9GAMM|nr:YncE family protein [Ahniella affigens]AVP99174.1 hypothetical protein C7S18_19265 [Ahniella affigens]
MVRPWVPDRLRWVIQTALLALAGSAVTGLVAADSADVSTERDGVAVALTIEPASSSDGTLIEHATARVRFSITDTTSGKPVTGLHPAAWLSRRTQHPGQIGPRTTAEKIQELLGGSIFSRADVDLNTFRVLTLNDDATISVVDPLFGFGGTKLLALVALPGVGSDWVLGPDGRQLYVTSPEAGKLSVADTSTWSVSATVSPCAHPGRLALQPDGHYLWVGCADAKADPEAGASGVVVVNAEQPNVSTRIATGRGEHDLAFAHDSRWAFVSNATDGTLSVIDVHTLTPRATLKLDGHPTRLAYSALSDSVYAVDAVSGTLTAVDARSHEIVARIDAEVGIAQLRFAPGDRYGVMTVPGKNLVLILDAVVNRIVQRAHIDDRPEQIAFSGDMAFVRRQGTASVGMIPLKEVGRDGQPLPVAEFTGGDSPFGRRSALADSMIAAPGESAVIVANPKDKAVYFYMQGMAAPMGTFGNYDREPRAVLVLDRSLREVAPGAYETSTVLPPADDYDVLFFLSAPRIVHAFQTRIAADPVRPATPHNASVQLVALTRPQLVAGQPAQLRFRLSGIAAQTTAPVAPADLFVRAILAPGTWHQQKAAKPLDDGTIAFEFTPPRAGLYYFHATSASLDQTLSSAPCLVLHITEPTQ